jgi:hypothetical protein
MSYPSVTVLALVARRSVQVLHLPMRVHVRLHGCDLNEIQLAVTGLRTKCA